MKDIFGKTASFLGRHKVISIVVLVLAAGGAYYFLYYGPSHATTDTAVQTTTVSAKKEDLRVSVTGSGQVYAEKEVTLNPVAAGDAIEVVSVPVTNDQEVKKDDVIAVLDTGDALESIRDAELSVWSAKIKMDQAEEAYDSLTEADRQARQTQEIPLLQAENRLAEAQEDLEDYYIRAPFDGIVTSLSVAVGDSVSRSDAIASVIGTDMIAKVSLNEIDAVGVTTGDPVTLSFTAFPDMTIGGTVSKIDTIGAVSQNVVSYEAEIAFDSSSIPDLKPGMSVDVEIVTEERFGAITVPIAAVKTDQSGNSFVMVPPVGEPASDAVAGSGSGTPAFKRVLVEIGLSTDISMEIVSGLSEGQSVVIRTETTSSTADSSTKQPSSIMGVPGSGGGGGRIPGM